MNILLTCAGRRNYLVDYFRQALNGDGRVMAADVSADAPAMQEADHAFVVPRVDDPGYVACLLDLCRRHHVGLLISLNDLELPILAAARSLFSDIGTATVVSAPEVIDIAFDKWKTKAFLTACGLATCATYLTYNDARQALETGSLSFPVIVKPRWGTASIGIEYAYDSKELELAYQLTHRRLDKTFLAKISASDKNRSVLIQECLSGDEYGLDVVNDLRGNYATTFIKKKLAMRAGETDRAITVDNPVLQEIGSVLGSNLKHVGNLDCDVFLTPDGSRVLELNPRFGGGYPFSHEAGANVPAALIAWAEGRQPNPAWLCVTPDLTFAKCDRLVKRKEAFDRNPIIYLGARPGVADKLYKSIN